MSSTSANSNSDNERLIADDLRAVQRRKLAAMVAELQAGNGFYRRKFEGIRFDPLADPLDRLPFTTRAELETDQVANPPYGTNLTYPVERYTRYCQTSGTGGRPMRWLDTNESWSWVARCWAKIFRAAGVTPADRLLFAFSFGPFLGFWGAFDSSVAQGFLSIPAGGLSTSARLKMILDNRVTVVLCTPTYALRMAEVARHEGLDLPGSAVRALIVAGEPGGSIPETKRAVETAWGARMFDHSGMTEIGPMSFECQDAPGGIHVIESEYIVEVIDPKGGQAVPDGQIGELVVTNLGRWGSPLIRYRTNDQVRLLRCACACGRTYARLEGGILGRVDEMFFVRGNNVFPTAVEAVLRRFPEIVEFRVNILENGTLTKVKLEVEPEPECTDAAGLCERVGRTLQETLSFKAEVHAVAAGTLPRFEMKAKRFVRVKSGT
ncbi:MAG TPA: AMP-binding protein [Tepidisphaeraceae bacterium]